MSIIRVCDFEFDGKPEDGGGVIEVGFCDLVSTSTDLAGNPVNWEVGDGYARLCNPGRPISPESQAVHHIDDADVADADDWKTVLRRFLKSTPEDCIAFASHSHQAEEQWLHPDWRGENAIPFLCTYKAALRVYGDEAPRHGNQVLRYWLRPEGLDRAKADPAHRAFPDAYCTAFLLKDLLNNRETTIEQMLEWTKHPALTIRCYLNSRDRDYRNGGEGTLWKDVDPGFLNWICNIADFSDKPDILYSAKHWLEKHEMDQREEAERQALKDQLAANGMSTDLSDETETDEPQVDPRQGEMLL